MTTATLNSALTLGRRFADDERGTFAMLLGLMFSVMLGILGIAIDYGRAIHTEDRLTNSLDAAALAAGRALIDGNMSDDEIKDMALKRLEENFKSGGGTPGSLTATEMTLNRATGAVTINTTAVVPTTFTSLFGVPSFTMPRDVAAIFDQQDIELAIQLDITGSMRGQKLQDLKEALNGKFADRYNDGSNPDEQGLFDILLPDQKGTNKVRIALAPYASGVNLGVAAAKEVTNDRHSGSGCTYDRAGSETTDDFVGSGTYFKGKADITGERDCPPNNTVRPMTEGANNKADREALKAEVDSYADSTSTAGQLGSNWAWNLIAPKWGDFWKKHWGATAPVAYKTPNTIKAVILMTDGEYNTYDGQCDTGGCTPYGPRGAKSNRIARDLCANMKKPDTDVIVYTIGFQLNHPVAIETLNQCATSAQTAYLASDGRELREAFRQIAQSLTNLRLTQ